MNVLKIPVFILIILFCCSITVQSFADCQGCCSSHGGVVCRNGVTKCGDGTSLSSTCVNKGCNMCGTPPSPPPSIDPNTIDDDHDGYTENQGDCNDYDRLEYPNQTWYKDSDNDRYSDGVINVTCPRPANYKVASELYQLSGDINDDVFDSIIDHPPEIYNINPTALLSNGTLIIKGRYFGYNQGSAFVSFTDKITPQNILGWSDTQIECLIPLGIQSGCLSVITNKGKSNCISYSYESRQALPWLMLLRPKN